MPQWVLIVIAVIVIAIAGALVSSQGDDTPVSTDCPTQCKIIGEFECNSGRYVGLCIGWWNCPSTVPNGCD